MINKVMQLTNMQAPHITEKQVECHTRRLLADFQRQWQDVKVGPVPIEDIITFLGLRLEVDDFTRPEYFGAIGEDVLGFIDIQEKAIYVNQLIDPMENPNAIEGRFNFTLAHEVGHYYLHQGLFEQFQEKASFLNNRSLQKGC